MQPAHSLEDRWSEPEGSQAPPENPVMREYEARRCHVCQCKYPSFGFGFPLARKGQTIWACGTHRMEVDRMLTGGHADQLVTEPAKLL
jgi:hypothetical protein